MPDGVYFRGISIVRVVGAIRLATCRLALICLVKFLRFSIPRADRGTWLGRDAAFQGKHVSSLPRNIQGSTNRSSRFKVRFCGKRRHSREKRGF